VRTHLSTTLLVVLLTTSTAGCGALLRIGEPDPTAIRFENGELRSYEDVSLAELDLACRKAAETLGYEKIESTREAKRVHWTARTAGGEPVELDLSATSPKRTELRIRVGVLGSEARSRLVLEQIHQSL